MPRPSIVLVLLAGVMLPSCTGPLIQPMVVRLDNEKQARVDAVWDTLVKSKEGDTRRVMLDVIAVGQLIQVGVDRANYRAEKQVAGGVVVMEVFYDRAQPTVDRFVVELYDGDWQLKRRESYTRDEVENAVQWMHRYNALKQGDVPHVSDEDRAWMTAQEQHWEIVKKIIAPITDDEPASD